MYSKTTYYYFYTLLICLALIVSILYCKDIIDNSLETREKKDFLLECGKDVKYYECLLLWDI